MKKIILILLTIITIILGGVIFVNSKDHYDKKQYFLTKENNHIDFKLPDQFNKAHQLKNDTKILILAFQKEYGHIVREFLKEQNPNFLNQHKAYFIADISKVPVIIRNMFILRDLKKSKFPVLLIYDKDISQKLNEKRDGIVIFYLNNKQIIQTKIIHSKDDLQTLFN